MKPKLSIAIPDSLLSDCKHLREKTIKIGVIARICSIFGVNVIYIYRDISDNNSEFELMKILLEYINTPQYLRRLIYNKRSELQYAGLFPPLRTPHHKLYQKISDIKEGDYREGFVIRKSSQLYVDVGLSKLIPLKGKAKEETRITVRFINEYPKIQCELMNSGRINDYWGYKIVWQSSIRNLIKNLKNELLLFTSRRGKLITTHWKYFLDKIQKSNRMTAIFGSPNSGIYEILRLEKINLEVVSNNIFNIFPFQKSVTIRADEAILGTLTLLNFAINIEK